jgi:hypothetical protein
MAADFLPDGKRLYIIVADDDCNIHVLEYDPEGTLPAQFLAASISKSSEAAC